MAKQRTRYTSLSDWLDRTGTQQQTLARLAHMPDSTISQLLRGSRRCSLQNALRLAEITGVPVENLVEWPRFHQARRTRRAA